NDGGAGTTGINAVNLGNGTVTVANYGNIDPPSIGIQAISAGGVNVTNGGVVSATGIGINANSTGAGAVNVIEDFTNFTVNGNGTRNYVSPGITVSAGHGIVATSLGGDVVVTGHGADGIAGGGSSADEGLGVPVTTTSG